MKSLHLIGALLLAIALAMPAGANDLSNSTWSETDGSNNSASPNGWTTGTMLPSQVEPVARAMMGALKRWYNHANGTATSGGAANVQTLTYSVAPASYATGDFYLFKAGFTNTTATTLNVNALGAKTVQRANAALNASDIQSGFYYGVVYDGTNFQLVFTSRQAGQPATLAAAPVDPLGTTSTAALKMAGLGSTCKITPAKTGVIVFRIEAVGTNTVAPPSAGSGYELLYNSGAVPANGDPVTGVALGVTTAFTPGTGGEPFSLMAVATGLTVGVSYWFDLGQEAVITGTAAVTRISCFAWELS